MILQFVIFDILSKQYTKGARFMIPDKYRPQLYDTFVQTLKFTSDGVEDKICDLCLNQLKESEYQYKDHNGGDRYGKFEPNEYYQLPHCIHKYHPNCIRKKLQEALICPI
mmetsp:Transcript_75/g.76  ORF Transcript_75/g.76 Transcript_75/m.76 type:complete len:110 (+) Transcript_75:382-711(+)